MESNGVILLLWKVILKKRLIICLKNYYTKSETYNKEEVNNLLNRYVTNDTFNNFKEEINQTITNSVNLDKKFPFLFI